MKTRKCIWFTVLALLLLTVFYIAADCIRLRFGVGGTKPLLTVSESITVDRQTYYGLGYHVTYYTNIGNVTSADGVEYIEQLGRGAEFKLFNMIRVWYWEE